jgi:hypothetical protein
MQPALARLSERRLGTTRRLLAGCCGRSGKTDLEQAGTHDLRPFFPSSSSSLRISR